MAIVYNKLHRQSEAEATLAAIVKSYGDDAAFQYASIYAQWGDIPKALRWLDVAYRRKDPGLVEIKVEPCSTPCAKSRASKRWSASSIFRVNEVLAAGST